MRTLWLGFGILLSLFSALQPAAAQQPRKFAFLVGISSYPETQLKRELIFWSFATCCWRVAMR